MKRVTLRTRLTLVHTGLFLLASTIVVMLVYFQNRTSILDLQQVVTPRVFTSGSGDTARTQPEPVTQAWDDVLTGLLTQSVVTFLILGAVAGALGWWLTGRVLRRVHLMTAQARRISTANLHQRIELTGPQDELKELADTFDDLLTRLDKAFLMQGRFIANASHELRTPLTVMRTVIQVGLSSTEPDQVLRAKGELLRSNDRSIALINGLLQLARGEQELHRREPVRLDTVVEHVLRETTTPGVVMEAHTDPCLVQGDELLLSQVCRNLVDNAARYNVPGGTVWVRVTHDNGWGHLNVANTGPAVPADDVASLFEPFHRGTAQRTGGPDGAGLGLSIVRAVAAVHGGRVHAKPRTDGGLSVTVEIPLSCAQPS